MSSRRPRLLVFTGCALAAAALILSACNNGTDVQATDDAAGAAPETSAGSTETAAPVTPSPTATPEVDHTFSEEVLPVLEDVCARCHAPGGPGATHWELATAIDAVVFAPSIATVVEGRVMPPWPASDLSVAFRDDYSLDDDQIESLVRWVDDGAVIDVDPATPVVSTNPVNAIVDPDLTVVSAGGPYTGSTDVLDDYRCLVFDPQLTETKWVLARQFVPDQVEVVHHAIITVASRELRSQADFWDATEAGPGWTCYGGTGLDARDGEGYTFGFGGWAPGGGVRRLPDGYATPLRPGDFLVVQIHYHFDSTAPADLSQLLFDFAEPEQVAAQPGGRYETLRSRLYLGPAEIPCYAGDPDPLCDRDAALQRVEDLYGPWAASLPDGFLAQCGSTPADYAHMTEGTAWSTCDLPIRNPGRITSVTAHMHELGLAFRMTLNPDTPDEVVLLDIPDWSFDWQFGYEPVDDIEITRRDTVRIECSWNRERAPYDAVGYVLWAEGTGDEMCYSSITTAPLG